jgi:hypothetical protein
MPARENIESGRRGGEQQGLLIRSLPRALRIGIKHRAVIRLRATPFGKKADVARRLGLECGRAVRTILRWQTQYRNFGLPGLSRSRSDRGVSHIFSNSDLEILRQAAVRTRYRGGLAREWRELGLPGSYESFRCWIRRLQEQSHSETVREAASA